MSFVSEIYSEQKNVIVIRLADKMPALRPRKISILTFLLAILFDGLQRLIYYLTLATNNELVYLTSPKCIKERWSMLIHILEGFFNEQ